MSVDALTAASSTDLEAVYGVGSNTARAIQRRFASDSPHATRAENANDAGESDLDVER